MPMTLVDRHIFAEWLKIFILILGLTFGLLVLEDMYDDLGDLLGFGAGAGDIFKYYLVVSPSFLPTIIPLALLVSILFSLSGLHKSNEIIAMRSCGLTLFRITRTLWLAGALLSVLLFYLNAHLVPWSIEQSRIMRENLEFAHELEERSADEVGVIYNLTFYNHKDGRLWFMNRFSEYTYEGYGITVSNFDKDRHETSRIVANEGYFDNYEGYWVFRSGREIIFDEESGEPTRSMRFETKPMPDMAEDPTLMKSLEKRPKDLSLTELRRILDKIKEEDDPRIQAYAVRYNGILANPFSALIVVGMAVPFAVSGVRVNPMMGVAKSFSLFFVFYLVVTICTLLGERHILGPLTAVWLPNAAMFALALWLYRRVV